MERHPLWVQGRTRAVWLHIALSLAINWAAAPLLMLALAWATMPEASLARERHGVILVGIARCIGAPLFL